MSDVMADSKLMCEKAFKYLGSPMGYNGAESFYDAGCQYTQEHLQKKIYDALPICNHTWNPTVHKHVFKTPAEINWLFLQWHRDIDDWNTAWLVFAMLVIYGKRWSDEKEDWV